MISKVWSRLSQFFVKGSSSIQIVVQLCRHILDQFILLNNWVFNGLGVTDHFSGLETGSWPVIQLWLYIFLIETLVLVSKSDHLPIQLVLVNFLSQRRLPGNL